MLDIVEKAIKCDDDAFSEIILLIQNDLLKIAYLNLSNMIMFMMHYKKH